METLKTLLNIAIDLSVKAGEAILDVYNSNDFEVQSKPDSSPLTKADLAAHDIIYEGLKNTQIPIISEEGSVTDFQIRKNWKRVWIIDPLDGTKEFIQKNGEFTVNIALIEENAPVLGVVYVPTSHMAYFGAKGIGSFKATVNISDLGKLMRNSIALPCSQSGICTVVASRSHLNTDTQSYLEIIKQKYGKIRIVSKGSSLKLCLIAEGIADIYPRLSPTMEWDIAAGHAVALFSGASVTALKSGKALAYNKENLLNPYFLVERKTF